MKRCAFGPQAGLTLLEILIAMLIFSVGILAVASMQGMGMQANTRARQQIFDTVEAGRQIESVLAMDYANPMLADPDDGFDPDHPDHGPFIIEWTGSTIEWEVDDDFPASNTKRIRITVRWKARGGGQRTFQYHYVKAKDFI